MQEYTSKHTFNAQLFEDFYVESLQGDLCQLIPTYITYFDPEVLSLDCSTVMNGIFKKGYIIAIQKFLSTVSMMTSMYSNDIAALRSFVDTLVQWQSESEFVLDLDRFIKLLGFTSEALDKFSIEYQMDYYNSLIT